MVNKLLQNFKYPVRIYTNKSTGEKYAFILNFLSIKYKDITFYNTDDIFRDECIDCIGNEYDENKFACKCLNKTMLWVYIYNLFHKNKVKCMFITLNVNSLNFAHNEAENILNNCIFEADI